MSLTNWLYTLLYRSRFLASHLMRPYIRFRVRLYFWLKRRRLYFWLKRRRRN